MTQITQGKTELLGLFTARFATVASPFVMFLALPPFYSGYWVQVEGAVPWLHAVAAIGLAGCAVAALAGNVLARAALSHPLVLIPGGIALLSVVLLPFTTLPALSLLGSPEHGFGALAYLDLAALTAAGLVTCGDAKWRRAAVLVACTVIAATFMLDGLYRDERSWAPFFFGDYLAFYAVFAGLLATSYISIHRFAALGALAIVVFLALLSDNKALLLALAIAGAIVVATPRTVSGRTTTLICISVPLLVSAAVLIVGPLWQEPFREMLRAEFQIGAVTDALSALWASLWSRAMLVFVGAQSLFDSPARLLVGIGWGHYNEALLADLPLVKGRLHELVGHSRVYWDALQRSDFHSHNQYFETLLSVGIGGLISTLIYGAAAVLAVPAERRRWVMFVVLTLAALQCLWFQMPHSLPVMAIAFATVVAMPGRTTPAPHRPLVLAAGTGALLLAACAAMAWTASNNASAALRSVRADLVPSLGFAARLGEIYHAALLQVAYARARRGNQEALAVLNAMLATNARAGEARSRRLAISTVNVISGLAFTVPEYEKRYGSLDVAHRDAVAHLLVLAPRRTDLAIPYFNDLLAKGREADVLKLAETIRIRDANDPVALWFSGIVLLADSRRASEGITRLRSSLSHGIAEQMPIPPEISEQIRHIQ